MILRLKLNGNSGLVIDLRQLLIATVGECNEIRSEIYVKADLINDELRPEAQKILDVLDPEYDRILEIVKLKHGVEKKAKLVGSRKQKAAKSIHNYAEFTKEIKDE